MIDSEGIRKRYDALSPNLDEKGLRLFAASEALAAGHGGIVVVSAVTGIARSTIGRGLKELAAQENAPPPDRVGRTGGGRQAALVKQPGWVEALLHILQSAIRGDPEADLLGVSKSLRHLVKALHEKGYTGERLVPYVGSIIKRFSNAGVCQITSRLTKICLTNAIKAIVPITKLNFALSIEDYSCARNQTLEHACRKVALACDALLIFQRLVKKRREQNHFFMPVLLHTWTSIAHGQFLLTS